MFPFGRWNDRSSRFFGFNAKSPLQMETNYANDEYGYANWFLNTGRKAMPAAPETSVTFLGNGQNIIYIDQENDLLIVMRWIDNGPAFNQFVGQVIKALGKR